MVAGKPATAPPPMPASASMRAAAFIVPDRDAPILFAKSPRSSSSSQRAVLHSPGCDRIDWEEGSASGKALDGRQLRPDYVFGYSIIADERSRQPAREARFRRHELVDGKSIDRGAPFGPVIVPKEFVKDPENLRVVTKVNGEVMQDGNTNQFIWKEKHLVAYATSILTLFPGDVISSGTPAGTGMERQKFLKAGDVVTIEIEGIGSLTTPMKAWGEKPTPK